MNIFPKPHLRRSGGNWHCSLAGGAIAVSPSMRAAYAGWRRLPGKTGNIAWLVSVPNPLRLP